MIGYLVLLYYIAVIVVYARPRNDDNIFEEILENDAAKLNKGFDLDAFRLDQLNLHNYYRSLHGVPAMTRDETLTSLAHEYAEVADLTLVTTPQSFTGDKDHRELQEKPRGIKPDGVSSGKYTGIPTPSIWNNLLFTVPNGATNVVITNYAYNNVNMNVFYESETIQRYIWGEEYWMYDTYRIEETEKGVTFEYERFSDRSTIKFKGPVQPDYGYKFVLYASRIIGPVESWSDFVIPSYSLRSSSADISWSYSAGTMA